MVYQSFSVQQIKVEDLEGKFMEILRSVELIKKTMMRMWPDSETQQRNIA